MLLKIGELAKSAGLTVRTLHHYDHIGLLSPSERSDGGFRLYNQADVERLHRIQALKQFGCSLTDIAAFLEEPGASPVSIISQQMNALDERARRARVLRERLSRLKERIEKGEGTGLTDWLTILELMTMYEKHLSQEELDTLRANKAAGNLDEERRRLVRSIRDAMEGGLPPESEEAQKLALRWMRWVGQTTGNDPALASKLKRIHLEERKAQLASGITPETIEYLAQSLANARIAIFGKYLTPGELEMVRKRRAAHVSEWPPLITEVRRQMDRGAVPGDPAVQESARRWESLLRETYWGDDPELEGKIRSAFEKEPDLCIGIGIDLRVIAFMKEAAANFQHMPEGRGNLVEPAPKPTAMGVAILRASHQLLDAPLVFEDPLALQIAGKEVEESIRRAPERYNTPVLKGLRASVVVRAKLAEEECARSRERGVRQIVILGAGLDTFAYRDEGREGGRIFEVDLPETQRWKRDRLRAAGIEEPARLTFVPSDFESSAPAEALVRAGFRRDEPAFVTWLGVTMYLEEEAIRKTLRFIASLAPGSGVVFDYAVLPSLLPPREHRAMEAVSARASRRGEPWKSFFDPADLARMLLSLGFRDVSDPGAEELNERYLRGREDGLLKLGTSRLVCAGV